MPGRPKRPAAADRIRSNATLATVRARAHDCRACELWKLGTQTVFGEGAVRARLMLVGEQPGRVGDCGVPSMVGY